MVLIVAMVCLLLSAALLGSLLRAAARENRQQHYEQHWRQALWLAESALGRAAHRLAADADYEGETWQIDPQDLGGHHPARVTITVAGIKPAGAANDASLRRRVSVTAEYPAGTPQAAKRTRQATVQLPSDSTRTPEP